MDLRFQHSTERNAWIGIDSNGFYAKKIGKPREWKRVDNIFDLVHHFGNEEDQVSANFAFILGINKNFLTHFLNNCLKLKFAPKDIRKINIETQVEYPATKNAKDESKIDIQITLENKFFIIIESKIWNNKPIKEQLLKYATILHRNAEKNEGMGIYNQVRLVLITQMDETVLFRNIKDGIIRAGTLEEGEFHYFRWTMLKELFQMHRSNGGKKFINDLFMKYLGDKMADKRVINDRKIKDVKEVLLHVTDDVWWDRVQRTKSVCEGNSAPDALYVAIYETSARAITHVGKVEYTERYVPARQICEDYPKIKERAIKKGWINELLKVYHLKELLPLPEPLEYKGGRRKSSYKMFSDIFKLRKLSGVIL